MKKFPILILLNLFYVVSARLTYREGQDIKNMGLRVLDISLHMLRDNFPHIGSPSFNVIDPKMIEIKKGQGSPLVSFHPNEIILITMKKDPSMEKDAFSFKLEFFWIFIWGNIFPFTGKGRAQISVHDYLLKVEYKNATVDGKMNELKWKVEELNITSNGIADKLELQSLIKKKLQDQFNEVMNNHLLTKIFPKAKIHLERAYPPTRDYIFSFPNRKDDVEFHYEIEKIYVGEDYVETVYEKKGKSIENVREKKLGAHYGLEISFPVEMIELPLKNLFVKVLKGITISQQDLPSGSLFQLTSRQFAQVIPDAYMMKGNFDIEVEIESSTLDPSITFEDIKTVIAKNLKFTLKFKEFNNTSNESLLETSINITARFELSLTIQEGDTYGYINLKLETADLNIEDVKAGTYDIYYKEGLKSYIMSGIDNWIKPYWSNKIISSGIYVEHDNILSNHKSKVTLAEGSTIVLVELA